MRTSIAITSALALLTSAACSSAVVLGDSGAGVASSSTGTVATTSSAGTGGVGGSGTGGASSSTGGTSSTGTGGVGGSGTGGAVAEVTGTVINRFFGEGAPADVPEDLTSSPPEALVWNAGVWTTYPGAGTASGSFAIPGVPAGPFVVSYNNTYAYTTARTLDLGADYAGRPGAAWGTEPAQDANAVVATLQNLAAWQSADSFQWNDPNGAGWAPCFASGSQPAVGATSLSGQASLPWGGALIDGTQGDILYASQSSPQQSGGTTYYTLSRFAAFPGVVQTNGTPTVVTGSLTTVTPSETVSIDFRASQFDAMTAAVSPAASAYGATFALNASTGATTWGPGWGVPLISLYAGTTDVNLGAVAYANPFPASWGEVVDGSIAWGVAYTAPGASSSRVLAAQAFTSVLVSQASAGPIVPQVTPPIDPLINGKSALGPLTGIGLSPVLSWSPPTVGTPTAYQVSIALVTNEGGDTSISPPQTQVFTTTTSVTLPPNLLQTEFAYVFLIAAVVSPIDASTQPFRSSPTIATAPVVTGLMTP